MKRRIIPVFGLLALGATGNSLLAQSAGGPYTISSSGLTSTGGRSQSPAYQNDANSGATSYRAASSPDYSAAGGFSSTIRNVVALVTWPDEVNEESALQLGLYQQLDDSTLLPADGVGDFWEVVSGDLALSGSGLASAPAVFEDTDVSVRVTSDSVVTDGTLTIRNVGLDDFGTYAADDIDDDWQVQFFGVDNPLAAPGEDASGTGQTNLFKFIAGLDPLDPSSRFVLKIAPVPGQAGEMDLTFSPRLPDRTYTVESTTDLSNSASWGPIAVSAPDDNGSERTVTDEEATEIRKFYRVDISKP